MAIRYPNGKAYQPSEPNGERHTGGSKMKTYGNRGMTLEEDINASNIYYREHRVAVIHKKPTPVQIVNVDYPKRSAAVIKEAYFKQASTTDYNGVYQGKYIDFEAKETRNKTSFPLKNFHEHQIAHMKEVKAQDGICFLLLRFASIDEVYLLDAAHLFVYWDVQEKGGRKSIPKKDIEKYGYHIPLGFHPRIDYLKAVNELYFSD
ncbi:Holliday junction resolvase RecU [Bacillus marinisedimentorum]|uniref:Holliday junction resolvase RecU n=1 Tax=Bacillus marinisedimentorum TaxID=1821260 RepID=UPI000872BC97|nr:Holliday junction resolvase RecU [Bacillus marinisedimentorum]